ncbi:MAG: M15 family metallopeptidase [Eubacteriales bacterium]
MRKSLSIRLCALALGVLMATGFMCACSLIASGPDVSLSGSETDSPTTTVEETDGTTETDSVSTGEVTTEEETTAEETTEEETTAEETTEEETTEEETTAEETTEEETTAEETTEEETTAEETTAEETTEEVTTETPWNLALINPWYPIPDNYEIELAWAPNGSRVDARCVDALKQMIADCKAAGFAPLICSSFRTWNDQTILFERRVQKYVDKGYSEENARVLAAKEVALPGTSEHQLGLAVDIVSEYYQITDDAQANTPTQQWLMANCHKYGFILRYPKDTTDLTGIIYEPWHYRYVGVEVATEIMTRGITLEEYLGKVGAPETSTEITANEETN